VISGDFAPVRPRRIIDAHQHFWEPELSEYALFRKPLRPRRFGDYTSIARDYLPTDYRHDVTGCEVVATVHVEAGRIGTGIDETRWLAAQHAQSGLPSAALIHLDLTAGDVAKQILEHRSQSGGVQIVGIRQHVHWHSSPMYSGFDGEGRMRDPQWREGIRIAIEEGLAIELPIFFDQAEDLVDLAVSHPLGNFILGHAGLPVHLDAPPVPFDESERGWKEAIGKLSEVPNLNIKLSGFWMCGHALAQGELNDLVRTVLNAFGTARCIFGSNFPVDRLYTTFAGMIDQYCEALAGLAQDQIDRIFYDNAKKILGIRVP